MDQLHGLPGGAVAAPALVVAAVTYWLLKRHLRTTLPLCSPVRLRYRRVVLHALTDTAGCWMALGT